MLLPLENISIVLAWNMQGGKKKNHFTQLKKKKNTQSGNIRGNIISFNTYDLFGTVYTQQSSSAHPHNIFFF